MINWRIIKQRKLHASLHTYVQFSSLRYNSTTLFTISLIFKPSSLGILQVLLFYFLSFSTYYLYNISTCIMHIATGRVFREVNDVYGLRSALMPVLPVCWIFFFLCVLKHALFFGKLPKYEPWSPYKLHFYFYSWNCIRQYINWNNYTYMLNFLFLNWFIFHFRL